MTSWERIQITRKRKDSERASELLHEINLVQRVSESKKTASQIVIAAPYGWKTTAWRGVKAFLMRGVGC